MYAVVILLLHFIYSTFWWSFTRFHLRKKELLNFQTYCPVGCDTVYSGGNTPTFHNELWLQTNVLAPVSLFMSLCFDRKSVKSQVSENIAALIKSSNTHFYHFSV